MSLGDEERTVLRRRRAAPLDDVTVQVDRPVSDDTVRIDRPASDDTVRVGRAAPTIPDAGETDPDGTILQRDSDRFATRAEARARRAALAPPRAGGAGVLDVPLVDRRAITPDPAHRESAPPRTQADPVTVVPTVESATSDAQSPETAFRIPDYAASLRSAQQHARRQIAVIVGASVALVAASAVALALLIPTLIP